MSHFRNLFFVFIVMAIPAIAGNWFPADYKSFPFKEGDLLASRSKSGKYAINKILKIDRVSFKRGQAINIQGQRFVAPEDDYLLVVSAAYGKDEFESLDAAKAAAKAGRWTITIGHVPNRPPGAAQGQILIGHASVNEDELSAYRQWKAAFDKGEASVF